MKRPTLLQVQTAIGIPVQKWKGQCYGISCAIVESGVVKGEAVYGHYLGEVHPDSLLFHGSLVNTHGWIILEKGYRAKVLDPTRWVFENKKPYLYWGNSLEEYDEGGNVLRGELALPKPEFNPADSQLDVTLLNDKERDYLNSRLGNPDAITIQLLGWLANRPIKPISQMGDPTILYKILSKADLLVLLPYDNRVMIERMMR